MRFAASKRLSLRATRRDEFNQQKQDRAHKALAATVQAIGQEPPEVQAQYWQQLRSRVPDFDDDIRQMGADPDDYAAASRLILARAQGYQDPLSRRKAEADIANTEAQTQHYLSQARQKAEAAGFKTNVVGGRIVATDQQGNTRIIYEAPESSADPAIAQRISGGLNRLATVPEDVGTGSFERRARRRCSSLVTWWQCDGTVCHAGIRRSSRRHNGNRSATAL